MAKNRLKTKAQEEQTEKTEKSATLKTPKLNLPNLPKVNMGPKTKNVIGLLLLLTSAYFLIAFTSFFFTWKVDQNLLYDDAWQLLTDNQIQVDNWLGKIGALVAHRFVHLWFGICSFFFVGLTGLLGFKLLFQIEPIKIRSYAAHGLFFMLWGSVLLGALTSSQLQIFGGGFGYQINLWLNAVLGTVGAFLLICATLGVYLITQINLPKLWAQLNLNKKVDELENIDDEEDAEVLGATPAVIHDDFDEVTYDESEPVSEQPVPAITQAQQESDVKEAKEALQEVDFSTTTADKPEATVTEEFEDDGFEIEIAKGDEASAVASLASSTTTLSSIPPVPETEEEVEMEVKESAKPEVLSDKEIDKKLQEFGEYDPTLDLAKFQLPGIELLAPHGENSTGSVTREELEQNKDNIVNTLKNYKIEIDKIKATVGPTVTLYEIVPAPGVRISKIKNLEDDIALSLAALGIRIIAPIPGRGTIGIEVPNSSPEVVSMKSVIASEKFQNSEMALPVGLGKTISNEVFVTDLAKMPHLLMAGATGQGKSVGLNAILASLLYKKHPAQLKFVLVDPKKVELTLFNKIERHYLAKLPDGDEAIITDTKKVVATLNSLCIEMDQRYEMLKEAHCRNLKEYNAKFVKRRLNPENGHRYLPYIVLVVDEFADLIMTAGKEVETPIARLAQLARAIGIHLIIATQRPSVNIITGTIKANFPSRVAFRVTSKIDSRTILDAGGAEQLIGRGDMLYSNGNDLIRLQCAFVDTPEVEEITDFIGNQQGYPDAFLLPEYIDESGEGSSLDIDASDRDALFKEAAQVVVMHQQGSASLLQRKLKLGYNRAGRIVDQLEAAGIIGPFEGSKARQVLVPDETSLEHLLSNEAL